MPFYEYECASCKHHVEVLQKISDAPLRKCPDCGKQQLKRLISAPVFRLKGGGWYETDFKSDQEKKRNLAGADEAPESKSDSGADKSGAKADSAADTKPAATKAEAKPAEKKAETASKSASKTVSKAPARARPAKARPVAKKRGAGR